MTILETTINIAKKKFKLTIVHSRKRKRSISLKVVDKDSLLVQSPMQASRAWINEFIQEKEHWILRRARDLEDEVVPKKLHFIPGEKIYFLGEKYFIHLIPSKNSRSTCEIADDFLLISVPIDKSSHDQKQIMLQALIKWFKKEAEKVLLERAHHYVKKVKINFRSLKLSSPRARWGSCSSKRNIRINWRVVMLPIEYLDYVVVHELCHLKHMDHSQRYWDYVEKIMPDYKARKTALHTFAERYINILAI